MTKVFFTSTPRGNWDYALNIHDTIESMGYVHTSNFTTTITPETFYDADEKAWQGRYIAKLHEIALADICVFEVSIHSLAVGQLLQEAIRRDKPVIAMYEQGKRPHFLRGTEGSETRVQLLEYSLETLNETLEYAFEIATELLTTRFTLLMPAELVQFLNKMSEKTGISRSEYIRGLIMEEKKKGECK